MAIDFKPEELAQVQRNVLGSKVITRRIVNDGVSALSLNVAVEMSKSQFRPDYEGADGYHALQSFYKNLSIHMPEHFFALSESRAVEDHAVFSFCVSEEWTGLARLEQPISGALALEIFRRLVTALAVYEQCAVNAGGYRPLLFICADSVYVSLDENGELRKLCLLPLPYDPATDYVGMPRQIGTGSGADVYMAAYLYLLLKYPEAQPFDEGSEYDALAERCTSLFVQRRPQLAELAETLCLDEPPARQKVETVEETERFHVYVAEQNTRKVEPKKPRKSFSLFGKELWRNTKKLDRKISDVKGQMGDFLSTERGDAENKDQE